MPFKRRILPTSKPYTTKEEYEAKIKELEQKIDDLKSSITVSIEQLDFPDWSKVTQLAVNTTYNFDTNGYLLIGQGGGDGNRQITTIINGKKIIWNGDNGAYKYGWGCMQVYLPIRKNITFSFNVTQDLKFGYFLSC